MALTEIPVIAGTTGYTTANGTPGIGQVQVIPTQEVAGGGGIVVKAPILLTVTAGQFAGEPTVIAGNDLQLIVTEMIAGALNPAPYVVTPSGDVLDLSTASRGPVGPLLPQYVLATQLGVPGGVATLGEDGFLSEDERPPGALLPWQLAELFAGLSDPSALTNFPGNDPDQAITLDADTVYENFAFVCSELIVPGDGTVVRNCRITTGNSDFGIRLDANTGLETGRLFEHCEIVTLGRAFAGCSGVTVRLCEIHHHGDDAFQSGRTFAQGLVAEYCWVHDTRPAAGAHADGLQQLAPPAADVHLFGCLIDLTPAPGYVLPPDTGFTGAVFLDPDDGGIGQDDPEPDRIGTVYVDSCFLKSPQNYSVVVGADAKVQLTDCTIAKGTTDYLSLDDAAQVWAHGLVDPDGTPLPNGPAAYRALVLADLRDTAALDTATDGQVPAWDADTERWLPVDQGGGGSGIPEDTVTTKGDLLVATGNATVVRLPIGTNAQVLTADSTATPGVRWETPSGGGGGFTPVIRSAYVTDGNVDPLPNTSGAWQVLNHHDGTTPFELPVPASAGDWVEISLNAIRDPGTNAHLDVGVVVAGSIVRFLATGNGTPAGDGDSGWYPQDLVHTSGARGFTVTSGDLDAGSVVFAVVVNAGGTGKLFAVPGDTFYWQAKNLGPHN